MVKKKLGNTELSFAPLAFGGNVFGWTADEQRSFELLDAFTASGFTFIDTADVYSYWAPGAKGGESETIIGNWLKQRGNRDKVIIATKVGSKPGPGPKDLSRKYIIEKVEESLQRLQTDYIDLYQSHYDDISTPVEETLEAYAELVKAGKVRYIGASNMTPERLLQSLQASQEHGYPRYESLQPQYNLYEREGFEKAFEPLCQQYGLSVIPYYSLASGFLTGKYRTEQDLNKSVRGQGLKKYLDDRGLRILEALDSVAAQYSASPAQIALAWLNAKTTIAAPIASATSVEQLEELTKAADIRLDDLAVQQLDEASSYNKNEDITIGA
ncbi:aldo/keto reductase [Chitinophaga horti]|uniref:Aldo/keto reductase n=1 Tax=Chitinophaga horti TaxID=2920382 RepID=A0ABY6JA03_9BACT|nr:aldo/keto reductase [Chitinophaga horti]UYQ95126.1 aldo/keto reductase [Chitinophaga horti]